MTQDQGKEIREFLHRVGLGLIFSLVFTALSIWVLVFAMVGGLDKSTEPGSITIAGRKLSYKLEVEGEHG